MCTTTPAPSAPPVAVSGGKGLHHVYVTLAQCADVHGHGGDAAGAHCHPQLKCHRVDGHAVLLTVTGGETFREAAALCRLACPIALTALLLYSRTALSMLFLGSLGDLQLAAGSLAVAFANITGYSVLSGLSLGMDPLCSQAFGANQPRLLGLTLYRSVLFLLCCSLPLSALWLNMSKILFFLGQDREITVLAQQYLLFSLPDLFTFSLIHPLRVYLRSQGITQPLTTAAGAAVLFHVLANYVLVGRLGLGAEGVAAAASASNFVLLGVLLAHVSRRDTALREAWGPTAEWLAGWGQLARLAAPSCVSVCLEWWWYEVMILLCGLLPEPKPAVASMGVLMQTTALVYVFPSSLGFGVSTRVGNELGANRPGRARAAARVAVVGAAVMGLVAMSFAAGMRHAWGRLFTADADILRLTAAALPVVGLCELGNCPQTVGCGVLRGSARPSRAAHVNLGAFYLVGMPVAVVLAFWYGVGFVGLWLGLLAAQVCCAGLMLYAVGSTDWEAQARRAQALTSSSSPDVEMSDAGKGGGHASAAAAAAGGAGPEKGEHDEDRADRRRYEPLISNEKADPGSVQVL
ncbi:protein DETOXIFICATION 52-like [Triticum dicoccoides]|uniref:protein DETOXIFICATION 52-like n=1 Tax=Triticum dicoccoides TaxID=85692 RepID=UPI000E79D334|nr:protein DETOXIFICATION 52-like [Triticum dicoccoides]